MSTLGAYTSGVDAKKQCFLKLYQVKKFRVFGGCWPKISESNEKKTFSPPFVQIVFNTRQESPIGP